MISEYKHYLRTVKDDVAFYLVNGTRAKSLEELYELVKSSPDEVFYHHVTPDRNDFYNWIKDVIGDYSLADRIEYTKDKELFLKKLKHRIDYLKHKIEEAKKFNNIHKETSNEQSDFKQTPKSHSSSIKNSEESDEYNYGISVEYLQSGVKDFVLGLIIGIIIGLVILQML